MRNPSSANRVDDDPLPAAASDGVSGADAAGGPSLGYLIRYAHRAFVKALARELEPHGITAGEWSALRVLWHREGLTQVELAERMRVEKASLTGVLAGLEAKGLIRRIRNGDDRRKLNLHLTPAGRLLERQVIGCAQRVNAAAVRGLPPQHVRLLQALLGVLTANLERPEGG
jgi:DNA-binding MarR family transcriptional regulator